MSTTQAGGTDYVEDFLIFSIGSALYTVPAAPIRARLDLPGPGEPWPGPELFYGGAAFPLVDPRGLFKISSPPPLKRCAVLQTIGGRHSALVVDRIVDQIPIDGRRFQPIPWHFGGREQLWFGGALALDDRRPLILLRSRGLAASCRAEDAAR